MRTLEEIKNNKQFKTLRILQIDEQLRIEGYFFDPVTTKRWLVFFTSSYGWEHASVSQPNKTPTWDIMCRVKDIFWSGDECCVEYHPREKDYVNMHEHCLHIWKPIGIDLPTPPPIMVGLKDVDAETTQRISQAFINTLSEEERFELAESRGVKIGNRSMKRKAGIK